MNVASALKRKSTCFRQDPFVLVPMIYTFLTTAVMKYLLPQTLTFTIAVSWTSYVSLEPKLAFLVFIHVIFKRKTILTGLVLFFG